MIVMMMMMTLMIVVVAVVVSLVVDLLLSEYTQTPCKRTPTDVLESS